ncbi:hypothetical protein HELRODRAFT_169015 [Helobdella robusta]|uniref:Protein kinase domain-containing protein n=1 Tax=Helobdella robusta TaxID=6412 RepID=T1F195_HELRO|nr:hypothetical protein HELRODRAFT_169015 [Helobdella robusta]ESO09076.1 hypothetical protein HELRODRAFT_169015 [Helobdella robusta]
MDRSDKPSKKRGRTDDDDDGGHRGPGRGGTSGGESTGSYKNKEEQPQFEEMMLKMTLTHGLSLPAFKFISDTSCGLHGSVYMVKYKEDDKLAAIKEICQDHKVLSISDINEATMLKKLTPHQNIMSLLDVVNNNGKFYLVFEYLEFDLRSLLDSRLISLMDHQVASLSKQLFQGLYHCHQNNILHMDLKPSNILISQKFQVKLTGFDFSRLISANDSLPDVSKGESLNYRAPEVLQDSEDYRMVADVWSCGCIIGGTFNGTDVFISENKLEQLNDIYELCGPPPSRHSSNANSPSQPDQKQAIVCQRHVRKLFRSVPAAALDLLDSILVVDPLIRISAEEALGSDWLKDVNPERVKPPKLPTVREYGKFCQIYRNNGI